MSNLFRPKEVAEKLGIGLSTFWLYVKQEKISVIKLSDRVTVVSEDEISRFISDRIIVKDERRVNA